MLESSSNPEREQEFVPNLSSSPTKAEQIQEFVYTLVQRYQNVNQGGKSKSKDLVWLQLELYTTWITEAHLQFRETAKQQTPLSYSAEWVLDNYYIIRQAFQQIKEDLPPSFYKQLPRTVDGFLKNVPRPYALARDILTYQNLLLEPVDLQTILNLLQEHVPLSVGELWALPIFLRYCLIESLANTLHSKIHPPHPSAGSQPIPQPTGFSFAFSTGDDSALEGPVTNNGVANIILSLRTISEQNWNDFFESVSRLERTLCKDPSEIYSMMDFKSRDLYRKEIEVLSFATGRGENEVAEIVIALASPEAHIGEILLGKRRKELEQHIGYKPGIKKLVARAVSNHATAFYLGAIFLLAVIIFSSFAYIARLPFILIALSNSSFSWINDNLFLRWFSILLLTFAGTIPVLTVATSLINWLITQTIRPHFLPKLDFKEAIPEPFETMVVIPALISNQKDIQSLVNQLELHYLRNPEPGLIFALLTDFTDADHESLLVDDDLLKEAITELEALNRKYAGSPSRINTVTDPQDSASRFYLLHRKRLWNSSEKRWIGWERKRGKLLELNLLLRGKSDLSFTTLSDGIRSSSDCKSALQKVHFVITLDTDTILPNGSACRLAGTLAHPLNRAVFNSHGVITSGYSILQPRMEIHPKSMNLSWFTRFFAGDAGLDLYSLAVSDAYQDLFQEGIYVGKGIYDVDAFMRSVDGHIPENSVLSHDLIEGIMGRAGLVSDITMIEDYPQNYYLQTTRQRRWIRGDWQLLPWLLHPGRYGLTFSVIDRWKIFDNLRRAMLSPALMAIFLFGMVLLPDLAGVWVGVVLISLGVPVLTSLARGGMQILEGEIPGIALRPMAWTLMRWLLAVAFLPFEAYFSTSAALITCYRVFISHRNLLQWTTAAHTARLFRLQTNQNVAWRKMGAVTVLGLMLIIAMQAISSIFGMGVATGLAAASPILLLWVFSPLIAWWINQPIKTNANPLNEDQVNLLRQVARRTWGFFERFVGPEDHWLPPDHFQESPVGIIAHHTSPTNIGLLLTSTLAAYDLGYLDQLGLATRLANTLETLDQLERFRGHFINWYDTLTLQPLQPRYISTVDSGNLAASFIVTTQACKTMQDEPIFRWALWRGYLDTIANLIEILKSMRKPEFDQQVEEINLRILAIRTEIMSVQFQPERWYPLYIKVNGPFWQDLSNRLMDLVVVGHSAFDLETLGKLQEVSAQIERHHLAVQRTISELVPWIPLIEDAPKPLQDAQYLEQMGSIKDSLPYNVAFGQVHPLIKQATHHITKLRNLILMTGQNDSDKSVLLPVSDALVWLENLIQALARADLNASLLVEKYSKIMTQSELFVQEMDFSFLYHPLRRVFHIGFNLTTGHLDQNYYDLLASEARISSIIAVSRGDVPQSHWLQLGRPVIRLDNAYILLSWSGTMFEYLMPPLFLRSYPGTLLAASARGAVHHQIAYGKARSVPWGISESGFYRYDANQNYQYRAFGVPGLGFKRGLDDDLVIAPYASLIAIGYEPQAVLRNLSELIKYEMIGLYGVYESIDFTADRLLLDENSAVVYEYMAHHQGMIMMALANFFNEDVMVRRMHNDPRIKSVELLLQEQTPYAVPTQEPSAEDVKGIQRLSNVPEEIIPWRVPVQTPIPQVNLLSNGKYNVVLSNMGGGYSTWRDINLTRWQSDGVLDPWGAWIYFQELTEDPQDIGSVWSATHQPIPGIAEEMQVTYFAHMAVYRRTEHEFTSTMEVTVAPDDPIEIRRIHLRYNGDTPRILRLTSYGEVILAPQAADTRHPAFNKLFIESEFVPELNLQIFTRRPRSNQEPAIFLGHMLLIEGSQEVAQHEADRNRFIGRNHTVHDPIELTSMQYLSGTTGSTLDPIFSLGQQINFEPHTSTDVAYLTFAADSREGIIALASRYRNWTQITHTFRQADIAAQAWVGKQEINTQSFQAISQILSALLYPFKAIRATPETMVANRLGQSGLWRFGISGDFPILLVELDKPEQIDLAREALQAHRYLHSRQFKLDVVIVNRQQSDYGAELKGMLYRLVSRLNGEESLNQRGGIFILHGDHISIEELTLLQTAARVLLSGAKGSLGNQLPGYSVPVYHLPQLTPTRPTELATTTGNPPYTLPLPEKGQLKFYNGFGGFSPDGREYVIDWNSHPTVAAQPESRALELSFNKTTPAPWVNVIGYPEFGFLVSETGSQCTWASNSSENRLTPWSNDPVCDPTGEAIYLRDEETGEVWTPTPLPAGSNQPYRVTHGAGYTIFEHNSHGLRHVLTLFASPEDPVKIIHLKVENTLNHTRRITATQYVEWVLGTTHTANMMFIVPEYDEAQGCLLATNPYNVEFGSRTAFLIASKELHGLTADRAEFLGRGGTPATPAALHRLGLETRITPGEDPCAVLQVHLDLLPGTSEEIYFVLGQGNDKVHALELARKYHNPAYVGAAFERTRLFWNQLLDKVQVHTPELATDLILNRWMLYQTLSCRIWGRTGFYQSSGAFGFRDQLQDVLALLPIDPAITRSQIINASHRQFMEGDVLHWWHQPSGRGVRTRFSDDLLWLPYVTALYIEATGDTTILDEKVPFLNGPILGEGDVEQYGEFPSSQQSYSIIDHCLRAIERGATKGSHGLPLFGTGDWNDGMNRIGENGLGESVWLAWFLCDVLNRFSDICREAGNLVTAERYQSRAKDYAEAIEQSAWDGNWYRRGYYDDGTPLGSIQNIECQIDAIAQSWSVLSSVGDTQRSQLAMQSMLDRLVFPHERLVLLFTPPFDKTNIDPGYIKGYPPGIRENGGQYTHAATWSAWAFAKSGNGKQASDLFNLLNPIFQSDSKEKASHYRVEPYVICADIYSTPPFLGRGGWTWYTGSAAWMYRLGLEAILGFKKIGDSLQITPAISPAWDGYEIRYRYGKSIYVIRVENPHHVANQVHQIILDGETLSSKTIPLVDGEREYQVQVIMG
jgi:cyclic beta-1,2-glucan synthetase